MSKISNVSASVFSRYAPVPGGEVTLGWDSFVVGMDDYTINDLIISKKYAQPFVHFLLWF